MKRHLSLVLSILLLLTLAIACDGAFVEDLVGRTVHGSGIVEEEDRSLDHFSAVNLAMPGRLLVDSGSDVLHIEAEDNLLEYIEAPVRGKTLVIETHDGINLDNSRPIEFYLTTDALDAITISSAGDVEAERLLSDDCSFNITSSGNLTIDSLECPSVEIEISSSGDVTIDEVGAESLAVRISSSGNLEILSGRAQEQTVTISSSGEYRASAVDSHEAQIILTSSGSATVRVNDRLTGRLSSSGNIYYVGRPDIDVNMTSSGETVRLNE